MQVNNCSLNNNKKPDNPRLHRVKHCRTLKPYSTHESTSLAPAPSTTLTHYWLFKKGGKTWEASHHQNWSWFCSCGYQISGPTSAFHGVSGRWAGRKLLTTRCHHYGENSDCAEHIDVQLLKSLGSGQGRGRQSSVVTWLLSWMQN